MATIPCPSPGSSLLTESGIDDFFVMKKKRKMVLSIDGGSVRGIIPATILDAISQKTSLQPCQYADIMGGVSSGSQIVAALNRPIKGTPNPMYQTADLIDMLMKDAGIIFEKSLVEKVLSPFTSLFRGTLYARKGLDTCLSTCLGDMQLKDSLKEVYIPAVEFSQQRTYAFTTSNEATGELLVMDLCEASSAAPYYLPAKNLKIGDQNLTFIDGGVGCNNPARATVNHAEQLWGRLNNPIILSLGTGTLPPSWMNSMKNAGGISWEENIFDISLQVGINDVTYSLLDRFPGSGPQQQFWRFDPEINSKNYSFDNASPLNLTELRNVALTWIENNNESFESLCKTLTDNYELEPS